SGQGYAPMTVTLVAASGGRATIRISRLNVAERLYRVMGGGIYRDTLLLGEPAPIAAPGLDSRVFGQDSAQAVVYKGQVFWLWGDTTRPEFPLGSFRAAGAVSDLPARGGLSPDVGVNLKYFGDGNGFVAPMCPGANFPNPPGFVGATPCYLVYPGVVKDSAGNERLYAKYYLPGPDEAGLAPFNDTTHAFDKVMTFTPGMPLTLQEHPERVKHGAAEFLYYVERSGNGFQWAESASAVRIGATEVKMQDPTTWEGFTALRQGTDDELAFDSDGTLNYDWRAGTRVIDGNTGNIYNGGPIPADQRLFGHAREPLTGAAFQPFNVSTAWNPYRKRYVQTVLEEFGTSVLGEMWFNEADTPMGPWVYGRKIVTHDNYTFYNPRLHGFFNQQAGRFIFFEGTYTTFLSAAEPTPRSDYNPLMYPPPLYHPPP